MTPARVCGLRGQLTERGALEPRFASQLSEVIGRVLHELKLVVAHSVQHMADPFAVFERVQRQCGWRKESLPAQVEIALRGDAARFIPRAVARETIADAADASS